MRDKQENFENNILLECELYMCDEYGNRIDANLDSLNEYNNLKDLYSEYGRDLEKEFRDKLYILVNFVLDQLSKEEYKLVELRYIKRLNYRDIGKELNQPKSTIYDKMKNVDNKLKVLLTLSNSETQ